MGTEPGTNHENHTHLGRDRTDLGKAELGNCTHLGLETMEYTEYLAPSVPEWEIMYYTVLWMYVTPTLFAMITLLGCVGNTLVIYIIICKKAMRTATNYLLLNLGKSSITLIEIISNMDH